MAQNNLTFSQINQRLKYSEKNKNWRKSNVDALCNEGNSQLELIANLQDNYDLYNSQLSESLYTEICDTLQLDRTNGYKFVEKFNILHNIINAYLGEELDRPFAMTVINNNKNVINEVVRERELKFRKYLQKFAQYNVEKIQKIDELDERYKASLTSKKPMKSSAYKSNLENINALLNDKYKYDLDVKKINASVTNIITVKEDAINKLIKLLTKELNVKYVKNKTFSDVLKTDREFIEIKPNKSNTLPTLRELNVLNVFYEQSENIELIQDRNYAGYVELMPVSDIITNYELTESEILQLGLIDNKGVYGTNDIYSRTSGLSPNDWQHKVNSGQFTNNIPITMSDNSVGTLPNYNGSSRILNNKGLNAEYRNNINLHLGRVYTVYWVSQRKVGFYTFQNEYGELDTEIVNEDFPVSDKAFKESFVDDCDVNNVFAIKKTRHVWYDNNEKYHAIEWKYIPEIWQGTRINDTIYKKIQPLQHAYQSLLDPYKKKLPIYGKIFNNRNSYSQSLTDRIKPWFKLYIVIMSKLLKNIANDKGVLTFLNISMTDDKIGWENTIRLLEESGLVPYNPFNKSQGTAYSNTAKIAEQLNATNSTSSQYYIQLLEFIEQKIKSVADMSDQRLAEVKQHTGSQMNQNATNNSYKSSEVLYMKHDMLWEQIMQGVLEMTISMLNNSTGVIRGYLNNEEIALINLNNISLEDEYLLSLQSTSKLTNILRDSYQMLHAMFQNDKIDLLTMIEMLEQDDTNTFKSMLRELQAKQQEMEQQHQESEKAHNKEMLQLEIDNREDMQIAKLDEIRLKGEYDYHRDKMKSQMLNASFDSEKDYNKDGIADYMQLEQLTQRINNETTKNDIAREALELEKTKAVEKITLEKEKIANTKAKIQQDAALKNKEIVEKAKHNLLKRSLK